MGVTFSAEIKLMDESLQLNVCFASVLLRNLYVGLPVEETADQLSQFT